MTFQVPLLQMQVPSPCAGSYNGRHSKVKFSPWDTSVPTLAFFTPPYSTVGTTHEADFYNTNYYMIYNSSLSNCNYINTEEDCNSICRSSRKWPTSGRSSSCPCCIGKWRTCPTTFQLRRTRSTHWELLREDRSWFLFNLNPKSINK